LFVGQNIGEGANEGSMIFLPPGIDVKSGKRNIDYYDRVKLIIERVEERRNKDEAKLADLFREQTRDDDRITLLQNHEARPRRRGPGRPPKLGNSVPSNNNVHIVDVSWKDGGAAFPKRSSRIGDAYQVTFLPPAGSHVPQTNKSW
jgi:hypothetical protein